MISRCSVLMLLAILTVPPAYAQAGDDWPAWGHDPGGQRFSPLSMIDRGNVRSLKVAWTFHTGDAYQPKDSKPTAFEATPIYVDGTLYLSTPLGRVIALDPVTGRQRWAYDPKIDKDAGYGDYASRGVSTWKSPAGQRRIFMATIDAHLIALDAATGKPCADFGDNGVIDLRRGLRIPVPAGRYADYEETSPPVLFEVHRDGKTIPAVGAGSKTGNFFILDRLTGKPVFGVEERPVPKSDVPGEAAALTQPFPLMPRPLAPQTLDVNAIQGSEADRKWCREEIAKLRSEGIFTPPSVRGSLIVPGNVGGMAWGGAAYDPTHRLLLIPVNNLAAEVRLIPRANFESENEANGRDLSGGWEFARQTGTPYGMARRLLRAPGGWPCTPPPWGTLSALDADTGAVKWTVPIGQLPAMGPAPAPPTPYGSIALGGPIVTAGGLVFMAGTLDPALRAFDVVTGQELWKGDLPTSARSMPMTFRGPAGKQYGGISAGGHGQPA